MSGLIEWLGTVDLKDGLQVALVAIGVYFLLRMIARTGAMHILSGMLSFVALYFVARLLELDLIVYVLQNLFQYGAIAALIIFQPELRSGLARLGRARPVRFLTTLEQPAHIDELVEGIERLSRGRIGAIVAIERDNKLEEYAETGTELHARISADLLVSIFAPYTPLHDGAILVSGDTIIAAAVILPLTQFPVSDRSLGTRHRAALGLSEETDALVIVVSEETSSISLVERGRIERNLTPERLRALLAGAPLQAE